MSVNSDNRDNRAKELENDFKYIFDTYDDFISGLSEALSGELFYGNNPEYHEQIGLLGCQYVDIRYIEHFLDNGLDPQTGLNKMVKTLVLNPRYVGEIDDIFDYLEPFISAGADISQMTKFLFTFENFDSYESLDDFNICFEVACRILDRCWNLLDINYIMSICDWSSVKPIHWEDYYDEENVPFPQVLYENYKYLSKKLKKIGRNDENEGESEDEEREDEGEEEEGEEGNESEDEEGEEN